MSAWGLGNFDNDAAMDFMNGESDRHVDAIEATFADSDRFALDEDADYELMPRIEVLVYLCTACGGSLPKGSTSAHG